MPDTVIEPLLTQIIVAWKLPAKPKPLEVPWLVAALLLVLCRTLLGFLFAVVLVPLAMIERACLADELEAYTGGWVPIVSHLMWLLEAPLAIISWLGYEAFKRYREPGRGRDKAAKAAAMGGKSADRWADRLYLMYRQRQLKYALLDLLCFGPRWNTHVNVNIMNVWLGGDGTLEVENVLEESASWQVVAYNNAGDTIGTVTKNTGQTAGAWLPLKLSLPADAPPQPVDLMVRPYPVEGAPYVTLPCVRLNGTVLNDLVTPRADGTSGPQKWAPKDRLAFNHELRAMQLGLVSPMMDHMFAFVRGRGFPLPERFVTAVYLPVGNPNTQFLYGVARAGYALRFKVAPAVLKEHLVFCTVYSRGSMPSLPCGHVSLPEQVLGPLGEDGYWLSRIVRKDGSNTKPDVLAHVTVALVKAAPKKTE